MDKNGIRRGLYLVAGAYLIYLGVKLFKDGIIGGGMSGTSRIIGGIASIAFMIFGAVFLFLVLRAMVQGENGADDTEEKNDTAVKIPAAKDTEEKNTEEESLPEKETGNADSDSGEAKSDQEA
ncbi:MAG: hypothetical protein U0L49_05015 [Eubacterium sp.]|nr:hypothetical protein [Eubacterium sp.]